MSTLVLEALDRGDIFSLLYESSKEELSPFEPDGVSIEGEGEGKGKGLPIELVKFYVSSVAYALQHMHDKNFVYR
jgi:serine/threonine protein kinase